MLLSLFIIQKGFTHGALFQRFLGHRNRTLRIHLSV